MGNSFEILAYPLYVPQNTQVQHMAHGADAGSGYRKCVWEGEGQIQELSVCVGL